MQTKMQTKVALITGATTGIGFETAKRLYASGFSLIITGRTTEKLQKASQQIQSHTSSSNLELKADTNRNDQSGHTSDTDNIDTDNITISNDQFIQKIQLELMSLRSVSRAAQTIIQSGVFVDVLLFNAGLNSMGLGEESTEDGLEVIFQVNYLSHFLLFQLLLPYLQDQQKPFRVVCLGSVMHRMTANTNWKELSVNRSPDSYSSSKLAMTMFAYSVQRQFAKSRINGLAANPGGVASDIWRNASASMKLATTIMLSPYQGAETSVHCATTDDLGSEFLYFAPYYNSNWGWHYIDLLMESFGPFWGACKVVSSELSRSTSEGQRLWDFSLEILKEKEFLK